ncbi:MAG: DNA polymerase III subunit gamma/tau [Cryomorphaceae bacterium]|nr:DNA polymerase III subunit gamma/tau [Cryomorphaceae bacterium]
MEAFVVSARKYRPQAFDSVVGQSHITQSLLNAINNNQLAQALLFTGPRGVGKTTCARILARMINRTSEDDQTDYSLNIFELDAASNNSVDDIRSLVDQVRFAPQVGNFKVYIIDEVHMLSQAAFNAFLKTLEEPPKHAIFILATTEKHKILPTILSRCQIYDFRRITVEGIIDHLKAIAEKEGVAYEDRALHLIAQKADGALRDALSIFDRMVSFSQKNVTFEIVADLLSVLDYSYYFRVTDSLLANDQVGAITILNEIIDRGFDQQMFLGGLASHLRDLWMCKDQRTVHLLKVSSDLESQYLEQAKLCTADWLVFALRLIQEADMHYKRSQQPQLLVELVLLRLATGQEEEKKNDRPPVKHTGNAIPQATKAPASPEIKAAGTEATNTTFQTVEGKPEPPVEDLGKPAESTHSNPTKTETTPNPVSGRRTTGFSIKSKLNAIEEKDKKQEESETQVVEKDADFSLSEEHLSQYYRIFVESKKDAARPLLYSTLQGLKPEKKGDYLIEFLLHSETQKTILGECQTEMMGFLRDKLGHAALEMTVNIKKEDAENTVKNPKEKLEIMLEKHPIAQKVMDRLDLKLDY